MKKLLLPLFLLARVSLSTFAQGFEPQVKVGYSYGVDNYKNQHVKRNERKEQKAVQHIELHPN